MTARGWCPSVWEPMQTGDGWLARVKPPGGALTAAGLRAVAEAAARWGNGTVELTSRANLQIRGLQPTTAPRFAADMVAAGLAHADPAIERRRNIIRPALPATPHVAAICAELERCLASETALAALPPKFGFAIDDGGLGPAVADITIRLGPAGALLELDGGTLAGLVPPDHAASAAIRLAHAALPSRRMRDLLATTGESALLAACGTEARPRAAGRSTPPLPIGPRAGAFGVGLPFGSAAAADLLRLAGRLGDGTARLTPWRVLVLTGLGPGGLADPCFITDPADPRLQITACPGHPACASATVETRTLAEALARQGLSHPVHISGCSKGCAHPAPAPITLVGRDGRFDLVRDGRADAEPTRRTLSPAAALAGAAA